MSRSDLKKQDLYEAVKTLVELENEPHIHLTQHKLYTLFSIGFQYLLFRSTKNPGHYIIRIEDGGLAEKLARKSKDETTRKFLSRLLLPRKLKYQGSTFFLDFFHVGSWALTNDLPTEKIKGALIIKNTSDRPMTESAVLEEEEDEATAALLKELPRDYFVSSLKSFCPKTITIAHEFELDDMKTVEFPFIKRDQKKTISGVTLSHELDWDNLD